MRIRIISSTTFYDDFVALRTQLEVMGHATYIPVKFHGDGNIQNHRRDAIELFKKELGISDCVLVVNNRKGSINNYIGVGVGIEIGMATSSATGTTSSAATSTTGRLEGYAQRKKFCRGNEGC